MDYPVEIAGKLHNKQGIDRIAAYWEVHSILAQYIIGNELLSTDDILDVCGVMGWCRQRAAEVEI